MKLRKNIQLKGQGFLEEEKEWGNELFQTKSNYILKAEADIFWHNCQDVTKRLKEVFFVI